MEEGDPEDSRAEGPSTHHLSLEALEEGTRPQRRAAGRRHRCEAPVPFRPFQKMPLVHSPPPLLLLNSDGMSEPDLLSSSWEQ